MPLALSPIALREARDSSGLSRQAVAIAADCSISAIQSWERGWKEPTATAVANLAYLYGVSMESLFHDEDATDSAAGREENTRATTTASRR